MVVEHFRISVEVVVWWLWEFTLVVTAHRHTHVGAVSVPWFRDCTVVVRCDQGKAGEGKVGPLSTTFATC